jgi:outer membrane immunogenic protein
VSRRFAATVEAHPSLDASSAPAAIVVKKSLEPESVQREVCFRFTCAGQRAFVLTYWFKFLILAGPMKKLLVAGFAVAALCGTEALAADMPLKAPPPLVPATNWSGFYLGIVAGGEFAQTSTDFIFANIPGLPGTPTRVSPNGSGGLIGAEAGYNYQVANFLAGIEGDVDYARITGHGTSVSPNGFFMAPTQQKINLLGTVRGRVGLLATPALLLYATGGAAFGDVSMTTAFVPTGILGGNCTNSSCGAGAVSATKVGATVGGGLEYAISNRLTVKVEYLYVDLGHTSTVFPISLAVSTMAANSSYREQVARAGLNFKLGGP